MEEKDIIKILDEELGMLSKEDERHYKRIAKRILEFLAHNK